MTLKEAKELTQVFGFAAAVVVVIWFVREMKKDEEARATEKDKQAQVTNHPSTKSAPVVVSKIKEKE